VRAIVSRDTLSGRYGGRVLTRFPPEPNGFLHIGHAKSICLNFGIAEEFGGGCNLRFDDTNPETEDMAYVRAIQEDVAWLGFEWAGVFFASDYFEKLYEFAEVLIRKGKAYVDSLTEEQIREYRGTVNEPGRPSPYRERPVEENLDLFRRMRDGEFPDGAHVLRAKIDMASPNMLMRDPVLYRIRHASHYRRGDAWCIYPLYDFTHCLSDALEDVTHSICTLEFENNRELYDWVLDEVGFTEPRPHQYEFNRLNLDYTVMSKRKLLELVNEERVEGWDDPRMPTLSGLRRRGVTPEAIRDFSAMTGVVKSNSRVDIGKLEYAIRNDLNRKAPRVMAVLRPLKVIVSTFPEGETDWLDAPYYPHDVPLEGARPVPFTRELFIERDDFEEEPPEGWRRFAPGWEVRLRYGYIIRCDSVVKDEAGEIAELHCSHAPDSRGGTAPDGRKIKGTIHWTSAEHSVPAEVRLYDRLFTEVDPENVSEESDFKNFLNPSSLVVCPEARVEPSILDDPLETRYQFERQGYFWRDPVDSTSDGLVFNRIVTLRDTWARRRGGAPASRKAPPARADAREPSDLAPSLPRPLGPESQARFDRFTRELGVAEGDARTLATNPVLARLLDDAVAAGAAAAAAATWIVNELPRQAGDVALDAIPVTGQGIAELLGLVADGTLSTGIARDVFADMVREGAAPGFIVARRGLEQISDEASLGPVVARVVEGHPDEVRRYREGKTALLGFFVGQVMRETKGRANPEQVRSLLEAALG
jgi:glutaminyl-tRNA synthetase